MTGVIQFPGGSEEKTRLENNQISRQAAVLKIIREGQKFCKVLGHLKSPYFWNESVVDAVQMHIQKIPRFCCQILVVGEYPAAKSTLVHIDEYLQIRRLRELDGFSPQPPYQVIVRIVSEAVFEQFCYDHRVPQEATRGFIITESTSPRRPLVGYSKEEEMRKKLETIFNYLWEHSKRMFPTI